MHTYMYLCKHACIPDRRAIVEQGRKRASPYGLRYYRIERDTGQGFEPVANVPVTWSRRGFPLKP